MKLETRELELKNGIRVYHVLKKDLPVFQMNFVIRCGAAYDPEDLYGLASITMDLLESGPEGLDEIEVSKIFENEGAIFSTNTLYSYSSLTLKALSTDLDRVLSLFSDILKSPAMRENDLNRERELTINGFLMDFSEPAKVAEYVFQEKLYERHPISHDVDGTIGSLKKITIEDVKNFYSRCFAPENSFIITVSDLEDVSFLDRYFGDWEKKNFDKGDIPPFSHDDRTKVVLVNMPVTQSVIRMGYVGVRRTSPDFNALRVANYVLGGSGFSSRLVEEVRTKRGFSYSVHSLIDPGYPFENVIIPGRFSISLETGVERTNDAIDTVFQVLEKFIEGGITEKELQDAQQYHVGSLPRKLETYSSVAATRLYSVLFGLEANYFLHDIEEIKSIPLTKVNEVIKKFFKLKGFTVVIVTDLSRFQLKTRYLADAEVEVYPYEKLIEQ